MQDAETDTQDQETQTEPSSQAEPLKRTRAPRKPRQAKEPVPDFPEPGTPASVPEDRASLFGDLDEAEEKAEAILDAPPLQVPVKVMSAGYAEMEAQADAEFFAEQKLELLHMLERVETICTEHGAIASSNHHRTIYSDFLVLRQAARSLAKKADTNYWVSRHAN